MALITLKKLYEMPEGQNQPCGQNGSSQGGQLDIVLLALRAKIVIPTSRWLNITLSNLKNLQNTYIVLFFF